jgi:hypothetical protein
MEKELKNLALHELNPTKNADTAIQFFIQQQNRNAVEPWQCIMAQALLFCTSAADRAFYFNFVLTLPYERAVRNHNLYIVHRMHKDNVDAWLSRFGSVVYAMTEPLLPLTPNNDFNEQNMHTLVKGDSLSSVQGGRAAPSRYALCPPQPQQKQYQQQAVSGGAPFLPVTSDESGTQFVDAEQISNHLDHNSRVLYDAINKLTRTVTTMQRELLENNGNRGGNNNYNGYRNNNGNGNGDGYRDGYRNNNGNGNGDGYRGNNGNGNGDGYRGNNGNGNRKHNGNGNGNGDGYRNNNRDGNGDGYRGNNGDGYRGNGNGNRARGGGDDEEQLVPNPVHQPSQPPTVIKGAGMSTAASNF